MGTDDRGVVRSFINFLDGCAEKQHGNNFDFSPGLPLAKAI